MKRILSIAVITGLAHFAFSQNFGIDQPSPSEKLDVNGNIKASGYILSPNRPAFSVYLTSHWTTQNAVIVYAGVNLNNGGYYSTSTGRFTAPVTGLYLFTFGGIKATGSTGQVGRMDLRRNGSILNPQSRASEGANYGQSSVTTILFLNAGDYVDTWNTDAGGWYTNYTFFSGHLL